MRKYMATCLIFGFGALLSAGGVLSSRSFSWQDRRINLRDLTPAGVTLAITGSTAFQPTTLAEYPVSVSFGAAAVAIGGGSGR